MSISSGSTMRTYVSQPVHCRLVHAELTIITPHYADLPYLTSSSHHSLQTLFLQFRFSVSTKFLTTKYHCLTSRQHLPIELIYIAASKINLSTYLNIKCCLNPSKWKAIGFFNPWSKSLESFAQSTTFISVAGSPNKPQSSASIVRKD